MTRIHSTCTPGLHRISFLPGGLAWLTGAATLKAELYWLFEHAQGFRCWHGHRRSGSEEDRMSFLAELWRFMSTRKKYWLMPVVFMMVLLGGLVVLTQGSV